MLAQSVVQFGFDFFSRLPIVVEPKNVQVSSDTGILAIRQFDDHVGLSERFIACLRDPRRPELIDHGFDEMVRQRLYGILAGYEDCNDHNTLRGDPVFKLVANRAPRAPDLAGQSTLSRFENTIDIPSLYRLHDFFIEDFIGSFAEPPRRLTLDLDAVDDPCHGDQQLALFHGFYEQYQYLPLVISCAQTQQILWAALRHGRVHAALGADEDLESIVTRLRRAWPDVVLEVRADAGFGVPWMYAVCERLGLDYTFGLSANKVLQRAAEPLIARAVERFAAPENQGRPVRFFESFLYRAGTWKNARRVIAKGECNRLGTNLRFVVTNRPGAAVLPEATYDEYAGRGESENRNKELKTELAGDRLSCHRFVANYFRFLLHAAALNLLVRLRNVVADPPSLTQELPGPSAATEGGEEPAGEALPAQVGAEPPAGTKSVPVADPSLPVEALTGRERRRYHNFRAQQDPLGRGHIQTWRTMLIKVAGEVQQSARRIRILIPAHWPHLAWLRQVCRRLAEFCGSAQVVT